jgi:alpha-galactosidase
LAYRTLLADDGLSYCTWNGIGKDLTEDKIFNALDELAKNKINISTLIIDDNWQSLVGISFDLATSAHEP